MFKEVGWAAVNSIPAKQFGRADKGCFVVRYSTAPGYWTDVAGPFDTQAEAENHAATIPGEKHTFLLR